MDNELRRSTMSKIPVPTWSTKFKASARPSNAEVNKHAAKPVKSTTSWNSERKINLIKPLITKSPPSFKEVNAKKGSQNCTVKRKSIGSQRYKPRNSLKQSKIPEQFQKAKSKLPSLKYNNAHTMQKENVLPSFKKEPKFPLPQMSNFKSLLEEQKQLSIEFVPSEAYRKKILSNEELTPRELKKASLLSKKKKLTNSSTDGVIKGIKRLKISKTPQQQKKTSYRQSTQADMLGSRALKPKSTAYHTVRRDTWTSGVPPKKERPNPYEEAMNKIRKLEPWSTRVSEGKVDLECLSSPFKKLTPHDIAMERIKNLPSGINRSPAAKLMQMFNNSPVRIKNKAFEIAMQRIESTKSKAKILIETPISGCADKSRLSKTPDYCSLKDADILKRAIKRIQAESTPLRENKGRKPYTITEENETVMLPEAVIKPETLSMKLRAMNITPKPASSIYKPLHSFNGIGLTTQRRLTDISEKSENESSHLFSCDSADCTERISMDHTSSSQFFVPLRASSVSSTTISSITPHLNAKEKTFSSHKRISHMQPSSNTLHTPIPLSFSSKSKHITPFSLLQTKSTSCTDSHTAPICTPLVLQNIARDTEQNDTLSPIKQKLDFDSDEDDSPKGKKNNMEDLKWQPRFSQYVQHIFTKAKLDDLLADEECASITVTLPLISKLYRNLRNPVAVVLSEGDDTHFVPLKEEPFKYLSRKEVH